MIFFTEENNQFEARLGLLKKIPYIIWRKETYFNVTLWGGGVNYVKSDI